MPNRNRTEQIEQFNEGINWVKNMYYLSPGFRLRLFSSYNDFNNFRSSDYDPNVGLYESDDIRNAIDPLDFELDGVVFEDGNPTLDGNAWYNPDSNKIYATPHLGDYEEVGGYSAVGAHEAGHKLDHILIHKIINTITNEIILPNKINFTSNRYSSMLPLLRKHKGYLRFLNFNPSIKDKINRGDMMLKKAGHDYSDPTESYADLIRMRYMAWKHGIYDSTLKDNPFTLEHLDALKKLYPNDRFFEGFDDSTIIDMFNTIAYNSNNQNNIYNPEISYT